jgi:hypothetical protein
MSQPAAATELGTFDSLKLLVLGSIKAGIAAFNRPAAPRPFEGGHETGHSGLPLPICSRDAIGRHYITAPP